MADFREEGSHHDLNDPPPDYGLYMETSRPPPYNPNLREGQGGERSGGTLRNTCKMTKLCVTSCYFFNSVSYREHVLESRGSTQSVSYRDLQASCGSKRCRCDRQCLIPPLCYGMSFRIVTFTKSMGGFYKLSQRRGTICYLYK